MSNKLMDGVAKAGKSKQVKSDASGKAPIATRNKSTVFPQSAPFKIQKPTVENDWEARDAMRTLTRADELRSDKDMQRRIRRVAEYDKKKLEKYC